VEDDVRFSNRPFGVKHFQTIHQRCSVDVAHGLVLLFGIGTKALPIWDSKTRRNNLWGALAVLQTVAPSGHTNSPRPSSREGHHSTARWSSIFLLSRLILHGSHAAVTSRVHRNSVPSTQMRCMIHGQSPRQRHDRLLWVKSAVLTAAYDFRSTPVTRHTQSRSACLKRASSGSQCPI
jgi:hypothetical protein